MLLEVTREVNGYFYLVFEFLAGNSFRAPHYQERRPVRHRLSYVDRLSWLVHLSESGLQRCGFPRERLLIDLTEYEESVPATQLSPPLLEPGGVGPDAAVTTPKLIHNLAQILGWQTHAHDVGGDLCLEDVLPNHRLFAGLATPPVRSAASVVPIPVAPHLDARAARKSGAAETTRTGRRERVWFLSVGTIGPPESSLQQRLLHNRKQLGVHNRRMLALGQNSALVSCVEGHPARIRRVRPELANAETIHRVALGTSKARLGGPPGYVPQGVFAGRVPVERFKDLRGNSWVDDYSTGIVADILPGSGARSVGVPHRRLPSLR